MRYEQLAVFMKTNTLSTLSIYVQKEDFCIIVIVVLNAHHGVRFQLFLV